MQKAFFAVTCRALIIDNGELLMVRHDPKFNYMALPGGRLELGEHVTDCLERELVEEMGIRPQVGKLVFINDWVGPNDHRVEFFFLVKNGADYRSADSSTATHGYELAEITFGDPTDPKFNLLPKFLRAKFPQILKLGEQFPTELVPSNTESKDDPLKKS
jgi:ADP-ribose pyrophosphatase YjhB (NUDIX family)